LKNILSTKKRFEFFWCKAKSLVDSDGAFVGLAAFDRAFQLWDGDKDFIDEYLRLCKEECQPELVREITQRAGLYALEHDDLEYALECFNENYRAYSDLGFGDKYKYNECIQSALRDFKSSDKYHYANQSGQKARIAFLIFGAEHLDSVLVRVALEFVRYCDSEMFDVDFFSSAPISISRQSHKKVFAKNGKPLICCNSFKDDECISFTINQISQFAPDIFISIGVLADYKNYFIATRFPSAIHVAMTYGPPEQYIPFDADFVIAPDKSQLLDAPVDGVVIPLQFDSNNTPLCKDKKLLSKLAIPSNATIITSAGRESKFQDTEFLSNILSFLEKNLDIYFIVIGTKNLPNEFLENYSRSSCFGRIKCVEWDSEYKAFLSLSDVYVDTFPSGGGHTIIDAMSIGIPVLTFNNYLENRFTQTDWRPGIYYVPDSFLVVEPCDWTSFREKLELFVFDIELRKKYGDMCFCHIRDRLSNPPEMVAQVENVFRFLLRSGKRKLTSRNNKTTKINPIFFKSNRHSLFSTLKKFLIYYIKIFKRFIS